MTPPRPSVFIEKIMPVELLNQQVYFENGGNPFKGLHRWYSRKPLSFSRASVLGSLLPAEVTIEEFEYLLGLDRPRADRRESVAERENRWQRTRLYKTPPSPERIKRVQELCEQIWGDRTPAVLDAFAGGGSIPFEASRYGLRVFASDLNPVAVVTMKAAIEFPLKFGAELQEDIDKWVQWVGDEAEKRLAEFFPSQEGEKVQNYLWAHTVRCPHCESTVPLSPNWWLDRSPGAIKKGEICAVKPIPNLAEKRVDFELIKGKKSGDKDILVTSVGQASSLSNLSDRNKEGSLGKDKFVIEDASSLSNLSDRNKEGSLGKGKFVIEDASSLSNLSDRNKEGSLGKGKFVIEDASSLSNLSDRNKEGSLGKDKFVIEDASSLSNPQNQSPNQSNSLGKDSNSLDKEDVGQDARPTAMGPTAMGIYNPDDFSTIARGVGKCPNCGSVIEDQVIKDQATNGGLGHQLYVVAFKKGKESLEFRIPNQSDLDGVDKAHESFKNKNC
jgi:hypothetical protein